MRSACARTVATDSVTRVPTVTEGRSAWQSPRPRSSRPGPQAGRSRRACWAAGWAGERGLDGGVDVVEREPRPDHRRQLQRARADVLQQDRERNPRVLRAVHGACELLLAPDELDRVEVEPLARSRQADEHGP